MNEQQQLAFNTVKTGKNVFLTGPAGSGKSYLIRAITEWGLSSGKKVATTALTGCAALLLSNKAKTLHSWAGVGLGRESADVLAASILKNPTSKKRWKATTILIIDEISMMTPEFFEKLDVIGKRVRGSAAAWGGIQLVLCGDFFQLPPVVRGMSGETVGPGRFAFESSAWKAAGLVSVVLTKIERQTDPDFQQLLNECRIGTPSAKSIELLKGRQGLDWKSHLIRPTLLFSRNADVDSINEKNVSALNQPLFKYDAKTDIRQDPVMPVDIPTGELLERFVSKLDNDANYAPHLELCKGCQVMLLVNKDIEAGLVNGSRGVVTGFRGDGIPIVQFLHGDPIPVDLHEWQSTDNPAVWRMQIPLRVAYAITIHKSQGATLDCALIDIGKSTFEFGQAYVALSRVRDLSGLYVWNLDPAKIMAHPTVVDFYTRLMEGVVDEVPYMNETGFGSELSDEGWKTVVTGWARSTVGQSCLAKVKERSAETRVFPEKECILSALTLCPLSSVKVVILGQDPYHGIGQAHGLSFSVVGGTVLPPSLKNIRKELLTDLGVDDGFWPLHVGTLTPWVSQGVLLLNAVLTVEEGKPNSHAGMGWEDLTQRLLGAVVSSHSDEPLVFLAWGKFAQNIVYKLRLGPKHKVLAAVHPSPLSAHSGFYGSRPFSQANAHLSACGAEPVEWKLSVSTTTEDPV